jgi:hypothetical protein
VQGITDFQPSAPNQHFSTYCQPTVFTETKRAKSRDVRFVNRSRWKKVARITLLFSRNSCISFNFVTELIYRDLQKDNRSLRQELNEKSELIEEYKVKLSSVCRFISAFHCGNPGFFFFPAWALFYLYCPVSFNLVPLFQFRSQPFSLVRAAPKRTLATSAAHAVTHSASTKAKAKAKVKAKAKAKDKDSRRRRCCAWSWMRSDSSA